MINKELLEKIARLETELAEVKEMAEAMKKRADGDGLFKPEDGEKYWYILGSPVVYESQWENHPIDHDRYSIGNYFPTQQAAEDTVRALKLIQKARESQNGFVPDWKNSKQKKYSLRLYSGTIGIEKSTSINTEPALGYWGDKSICEQFVIENFHELIWFFTEYRR